VKPPRGKPSGIPIRMAELSVAFSPPSLKLRRALLAIHPHGKPWGFLAKESKKSVRRGSGLVFFSLRKGGLCQGKNGVNVSTKRARHTCCTHTGL